VRAPLPEAVNDPHEVRQVAAETIERNDRQSVPRLQRSREAVAVTLSAAYALVCIDRSDADHTKGV